MQNKQNLIAKYGKKFAADAKAARPMLEGIHYADGTVFVSNSKYALRIKNAHSFTQHLTLHAKTGQPIEGEYPNVSKIFDSCSFDSKDLKINISRGVLDSVIKRVRCAADVASRLDKEVPIVSIVASNGSAHLQIKNEDQQVEFKAFFGNATVLDFFKVSLNAEYLHTALSFLKDAWWVEQVTIKFKGTFNPIILTDGQDIDILILPFRVAE